jgi:hypothetical protein
MNVNEYNDMAGKKVMITVNRFGKISQHIGILGLGCGDFVRLIHHKQVPSYIKQENATVYTYYEENTVIDIKLVD